MFLLLTSCFQRLCSFTLLGVTCVRTCAAWERPDKCVNPPKPLGNQGAKEEDRSKAAQREDGEQSHLAPCDEVPFCKTALDRPKKTSPRPHRLQCAWHNSPLGQRSQLR